MCRDWSSRRLRRPEEIDRLKDSPATPAQTADTQGKATVDERLRKAWEDGEVQRAVREARDAGDTQMREAILIGLRLLTRYSPMAAALHLKSLLHLN